MGNERGKHKAWTKAGFWAKGMDWGLSLTVRRCCCRKWHTWSEQPLYALCARLLQAQSSLFVSFKENRTNWNVLGCYIEIASCLSDSGWKCVRSVIDLSFSLLPQHYICFSLLVNFCPFSPSHHFSRRLKSVDRCVLHIALPNTFYGAYPSPTPPRICIIHRS